MKWLKAFVATSTTLGPVLIKQLVPGHWSTALLLAYCALVYVAWLQLLRPDERFTQVRGPTLDTRFKDAFAEFSSGQDPPFRVFVFVPRGFWRWRRLHTGYSFNSHRSQPDFGISWPKGHGLVWDVFLSGQAKFCHRDDAIWNEGCGLTDKEKTSTNHLWAVFAIPLRKPVKSEAEVVSSKVVAVLSFDAISPEGAEILREHYERFRVHQNRALLDCATLVSLYF